MNTAYQTWDGEGDAPRWDYGVTDKDPQHLASLASDHARDLESKVANFENRLDSLNPVQQAKMREKYSPMYYDLHRTHRAREPARASDHVATADLARKLAEARPIDLAAAQNVCAGLASPEAIAEEYMVWKHSLLPQHVKDWPDGGAGTAVTKLAGLTAHTHALPDLESLDQGLNDTYGIHTRSDTLARVGFAHAHPSAFVRGTTTYPEGNMLIGQQPGHDEVTYHNNKKTIAEEMAHSMLQRHYKVEGDEYAKWIKDRTASHSDKGAHLARGAQGMRLPERGDYTEELAHAMAHGVFGKPSMEPESHDAPTDEAVAYTGRAFRKTPAMQPAAFRSLP